jgi:hypothetical protein
MGNDFFPVTGDELWVGSAGFGQIPDGNFSQEKIHTAALEKQVMIAAKVVDDTSSDNTTPDQAYSYTFHERNIKPEEGRAVNRWGMGTF